MIDLHTHSTASDGTLTPREVVLLAAAQGLSAVFGLLDGRAHVAGAAPSETHLS